MAGSPVASPEAAFDSATFLVASRELLSSPSPSDAAVARFLRSFPLASLLAALQGPEAAPHVRQAALQCLQCAVRSPSAAPQLPSFLPAIEQGLFSPSAELQSLSCVAARRIGETSSSSGPPSSSASTSSLPQPAGAGAGAGIGGGAPLSPPPSPSPSAAQALLDNKVILRGLLECVASSSMSLATSASDAILALCGSFPGAVGAFLADPTLSQFRGLLTQPPATVQQRLVSLAIRLAASSPEGASRVEHLPVLPVLLDMIGGQGYCQLASEAMAHQAQGMESSAHEPGDSSAGGGVPPVLSTAVSPPDELVAMTACELLTDFVRHPGSVALLAKTPLPSGALLHLLAATASPACAAASPALGMVVLAAWKAAAYLVSPPSPAVRSPLSQLQGMRFAECLARVCWHLEGGGSAPGRDVAMAEAGAGAEARRGGGGGAGIGVGGGAEEGEWTDGRSWEEAVSEAVTIFSGRMAGASLLLQPSTQAVAAHLCKAAFGVLPRQQVTPELQVAALHALASLLGAERGETRHLPGTTAPEVLAPPENLELGEEEEEALREAVYYTATEAKGGPTLGSVLLSLLQQEETMRVAVYRVIAVLVERPWGVAEVCGNAKVVELISDPRSETNKEAMDWRHTALVAAATAASAASSAPAQGPLFSTRVSPTVVSKLEDAAKLGPYAARRTIGTRSPVVAVEERPPMGA